MIRILCAAIRRRYRIGDHSALWVDVRYLEPFGVPTWTVRVRHMDGTAELARGPSLLRTIFHAWRRAADAAMSDAAFLRDFAPAWGRRIRSEHAAGRRYQEVNGWSERIERAHDEVGRHGPRDECGEWTT